jgi:hypothetical protein
MSSNFAGWVPLSRKRDRLGRDQPAVNPSAARSPERRAAARILIALGMITM